VIPLPNLQNLESTFVVIKADQSADPFPVSDTIWMELGPKYENFMSHTFVAAFNFTEDREMLPAMDASL
jgi:hypothetical protein